VPIAAVSWPSRPVRHQTGDTVHELIQTLRLPRWQFVLRVVVVALVAALLLALGVWWAPSPCSWCGVCGGT
jgi:hypothetical protein